MHRNPSTSLDDRYRLVLSQEERFAKAVAIRVIDRPALSAWMILIPFIFLLYMFRYQKFRAGTEAFAREFIYTRKLALEAAMDSINRRIRKPEATRRASDSYTRMGIADEAASVRQKQRKEIELLFDHYERLLNARGESYESLVKNAYLTAEKYKQFTDRLRKAEHEVTRAVMQEFGHKEGFPEIIAKIEEAVEGLREEELDRIFHSR